LRNLWNGELAVATHDGMTDEAAKYRRLIDSLQRRIVAVPAPPPSSDYAAVELAQTRMPNRMRGMTRTIRRRKRGRGGR